MSKSGATNSRIYLNNLELNLDYLSIPRALTEYNSKMLYSSYLVLESQLAQVDPIKNPDVYEKLHQLTENLFNSWVMLGYKEGSGLYGSAC